jgi:hypothetical protein
MANRLGTFLGLSLAIGMFCAMVAILVIVATS